MLPSSPPPPSNLTQMRAIHTSNSSAPRTIHGSLPPRLPTPQLAWHNYPRALLLQDKPLWSACALLIKTSPSLGIRALSKKLGIHNHLSWPWDPWKTISCKQLLASPGDSKVSNPTSDTLLAGWPWTSHSTFLGLGFLFTKMGIMTATLSDSYCENQVR